MKSTYSQIGQDLHVVEFYKGKSNGYFVEAGAYDGVCLSNTILLETKYNWSGILVECNPDLYNKCKQNRKAICINSALFGSSNKTVDFALAEEYGGVTSYINAHKDKVQNAPHITLNTKTLFDVLVENNAPHFIDYLSLDTEGTEFEILKNFKFNKYKFGYITIEHNFVNSTRNALRSLLEHNNYVHKCSNIQDDDYIYKSLVIAPIKQIYLHKVPEKKNTCKTAKTKHIYFIFKKK